MPESSQADTYAVGDIMVTGFADGTLHESTAVLHGISGDEATALLLAASLPPEPVLDVNAFLIRTAGMLVLVDAGCGDGMGPDAGCVPASLAAAGVAPGDVDLVLLTHMHPDHIGGLLGPDGAARFGRARVLAPAADAAVFLDTAIAESVPDEVKPVFAKARAVASAYAGRFGTFEGAGEVAPGISPVALPGHSPGHTGFRVTDGGRSLLIWGDVVHVPAIQFARPDVGMIFDADPALAERTRRDAFVAVANSGEVIAGMHMPRPGFARIAAVGDAFRFDAVASKAGASA